MLDLILTSNRLDSLGDLRLWEAVERLKALVEVQVVPPPTLTKPRSGKAPSGWTLVPRGACRVPKSKKKTTR